MKHEDAQVPPADAGRLETPVRPVAYVQRMGSYQGVPAYGCLLTIEAEQRMKVNDALYGQLELDQAVAAERERLHNLLRLVADEPNIDKARALADAELHGPNVPMSRTQQP